MDIIRPVAITDAQFVSSNVPETDYSAYSSATTYALGARVIVTSSGVHKCYESLQASNLNHAPQSSPTWWLDLGYDNRWSMFDTSVSTATSNTGSIVVSLMPGVINSMALLGMSATSVTVTMVNSGTTVYNQVYDLPASYIYDFYTYMFEPVGYKTFLVLNDLPQYAGATLTVTIDNGANVAKCSALVVGNSSYIGGLQWGASVGIIDYSTKETDTFGNTTIVKRAYSKKLSGEIFIQNDSIDSVFNMLSAYRSTPVVWIGDGYYESTIIFGYFKDFNMVLKTIAGAMCTIEIEGLI